MFDISKGRCKDFPVKIFSYPIIDRKYKQVKAASGKFSFTKTRTKHNLILKQHQVSKYGIIFPIKTLCGKH